MHAVRALRVVSSLEGLSYLILVFVAMPLKYVFAQPLAVRISGAGHGWLFVAFVAALVWAMVGRRWSIGRGAWLFALSLVPFGFLLIDRQLRAELERTVEPQNAP
jgi:integral membrane protein